MQIKITVDATPEEMRRFFGLPDVAPLQEEMIERMREKMRAGEAGFDPLTLMQHYLAPNMSNLEAMQKAFWESVTAASGGKAKK
ncbi:MAG TPA: DUF6489 family protein [Gammaproteobacteria bacterium]|nr:DUF6489 family protein [Gammaproteobacteria bacterium]